MSAGNLVVNQGTQTGILVDVAGTTDIGVVKIDTSAAGTYGSLWSGNVGISSGTLTALPNIPGGSISVTAGTINAATISVLPNTPGGTINLVNSIGTIQSGTVSLAAGTSTAGNVGLSDVFTSLKYITNFLSRPIWMRMATGALRVTLENSAGAIDTGPTIPTVTTVTGLTNIGGFDAKQGITNSLERNLWYNSARTRIV